MSFGSGTGTRSSGSTIPAPFLHENSALVHALMTAPSVSVIVPTFNRSAWIAATLRTVLAQTQRPHEVIVIDDGSADDTRQLWPVSVAE
jgi:cellulose synthase/poly-beta-1,6-N-acetylglucosamine synthase-like glycosyltransferase